MRTTPVREPGAAIRVVLLPETIAGYIQALRFAASLGAVVSVTADFGETCFTSAQVTALNAALAADELRHVTVVASSGDDGAAIVRCSAAAPFTKGQRGIECWAAGIAHCGLLGHRVDIRG
ncbi:MAG: hypothetical protein ABSB76_15775 [Streptosporangiaceae bacterium]